MTRTEILANQEMSDPPTPPELRVFLNDPELDFTPTDLVRYVRKLRDKTKGDHRKCAGCPICSDLWVLEHAAEYMEAMVAVIDAMTPKPCVGGIHSFSFHGPCMSCGEPFPETPHAFKYEDGHASGDGCTWPTIGHITRAEMCEHPVEFVKNGVCEPCGSTV